MTDEESWAIRLWTSTALARLCDRPARLALYLFTWDRATQDRVLAETRSGGGCLHDTVSHMIGTRLPFGGLGESGIGVYHRSGELPLLHALSLGAAPLIRV